MIQLLIEYVNEHKVVLELNKKNKKGNYLLLQTVYRIKLEMIKLLMAYAKEYSILLEVF